MEKKVEFESLDHDTQVKIVRTLMCYDKCHIEYDNDKIEVTPNWCICLRYPEAYWVSQNFYKKDFDFNGFDYTTAWDNITQFWDSMTNGQRLVTRNNFENMTDLFVELVIQKYLLKKGK